MKRYFQVQPDRVVIPPRGLLSGPGATHRHFAPGEILELEAVKVDRFVRGRVRAGDLVEVKEPGPAPAPKKKPEPRALPGVPALDLAAGHKKEG